MSCWICDQIRNGKYLLYQDDDVAVMLADRPAVRGETVVALKRHETDISKLSLEEATDLMAAAYTFLRRIREKLNPQKVYIVMLNDWVDHVHFTLYPKYDQVGPIAFAAERKVLNETEAAELLEMLRESK